MSRRWPPAWSNWEKQVKALSLSDEDRARAALLDQAAREGKLVPLSAKSFPLVHLKALLADLPAEQVPLEQRTPNNVVALSVVQPGVDSPETVVRRPSAFRTTTGRSTSPPNHPPPSATSPDLWL